MGNEGSKYREQIEQNQRRINILISGDQSNGKSSLANTIYRVLTEQRDISIADVGYQQEGYRCTTDFGHIDLRMGNIHLFDIPGFGPTMEGWEHSLAAILAGLKNHTEILEVVKDPQGSVIDTYLVDLEGAADSANAIDFVIFVIDATKMLSEESGWFGNYVALDRTKHLQTLRPFYDALKRLSGKGTRESRRRRRAAKTPPPSHHHSRALAGRLFRLSSVCCLHAYGRGDFRGRRPNQERPHLRTRDLEVRS